MCKRSQSDETEPVETKPIAVSSMAHAIEGMVCKGTCQKDCFCRAEVLSVRMCFACDPVQVNFSFCPAEAYEICIWLDPLAELLYLYGCAVYDLDIGIKFEGV